MGVAKGTSSLFKKSVFGLFNSVGGLTESLANAAAHATFDKQYIRERIERRESEEPEHILDGQWIDKQLIDTRYICIHLCIFVFVAKGSPNCRCRGRR